ncbi:MAG: hypothetical protein EOM47_06480 [Bacteroidia bacterium]|nr:hypothetical protein [Bacteroidia bacterium]
MKTIYKAISARLKTEVPELAWIDYDKGQMNVKPGERPALKFPAALLRIEVPTASDITDTTQDASARITVRLIFEALKSETATAYSEAKQDKSLEPYDVIADVYAALQGYETNHFNALSRKSSSDEKRTDGYFAYQHIFTCTYEDLTAD